MKYKLLFIASLIFCTLTQAQTTSFCLDYTNFNASGVYPTYGPHGNPTAFAGAIDFGPESQHSRHTVHTRLDEYDPMTVYDGKALKTVPEGSNASVRLGNHDYCYNRRDNQCGSEAITYIFTVSADFPLLLMNYAVVLQDFGHTPHIQPFFKLEILDVNDNLVDPCGYALFIPGTNTSDWNDIPWHAIPSETDAAIKWKDWTKTTINLEAYIGQTIKVRLTTSDCVYYVDFGYAYFTLECAKSTLSLLACGGDSYTLKAPDGYDSYEWDNGDRTQTSTRLSTETDTHIWCKITSTNGCQFRMSGYTTNTLTTVSKFIRDTICEGEIYDRNYFSLPVQERGTYRFYNTFINLATCSNEVTELELTVLHRYTRFKTAICQGSSYTENGFNIIEPVAGVRRDTLFLTSQYGHCDSLVCLELTVNPTLTLPNTIVGDTSPCTIDELATYSFAGAEFLTNFSWNIPNNAVVVGRSDQPQISLYFTDETPATLSLNGENGCGSGSVSLNIYPSKTHFVVFTDTVCTGIDYDKYGFRLGVQNEIGYFAHTHEFKTILGCDSTVVLALTVFPTPTVPSIVGDTTSCNPGDEIKLLAMDNAMVHAFNPEMLKNGSFSYAYDCDVDYLWSTGNTEHSITEKPNSTTTYSVTLFNSMGCSATAFQRVVVGNNAPQTIYETICAGETYTKYGLNATVSDTYPASIANGECTIPLTIDLTVLPVYNNTIRETVCYGETYTGHGLNITPYQEGLISQIFRYQTKNGCDSIVTLELFVLPEKERIIHDTICQNDVYVRNGFTLPQQIFPGLQTHTKIFTSAQDCDSTVTLRLFVKPVYAYTISDEVEQNGVYNKYGFDLPKVTQNTTVTRNLKSAGNCDSTVTLNLKVINTSVIEAVNDTVSIHSCGEILRIPLLKNDFYTCAVPEVSLLSAPVLPGGTAQLVNDTLIYRFQNVSGRDSLQYKIVCDGLVDSAWVFIEIKNTALVYSSLDKQICKSDSYTFGSRILTESGVYNDTIPSLAGCDSIVTLYLTVETSAYRTVNEQIYTGEEYLFGNQRLTEQGAYRDTIKSFAGCDSIITTLHLIVDPPVIVDPNPPDVVDPEVFDCPEIEIPIFFTPNSDGSNDKWEIRNIDCYEHTVEIYDRFGKLLGRWENNFTGWDGANKSNRMPSTDYWYVVTLNKERTLTGHFTLLR